nr:MAG TPA: YvrJ protein family protein [Caudoviricetes sp.]
MPQCPFNSGFPTTVSYIFLHRLDYITICYYRYFPFRIILILLYSLPLLCDFDSR